MSDAKLAPKGDDLPISVSDLPRSIQDVAECLGMSIVFKLVEHFGGVELRIPRKFGEEHKLLVLGQKDAEALCEYCPGDRILVPISLGQNDLRQRIAQLEQANLKRWQIARELGITERHVRRLANRNLPAPTKQIGMFDDWMDD